MTGHMSDHFPILVGHNLNLVGHKTIYHYNLSGKNFRYNFFNIKHVLVT